MAKKKKMGRPKLPRGTSRASLITLRVQPAERKRIEAAAKREGKPLSEWIRETLLAVAGPVTVVADAEGVGIEPQR